MCLFQIAAIERGLNRGPTCGEGRGGWCANRSCRSCRRNRGRRSRWRGAVAIVGGRCPWRSGSQRVLRRSLGRWRSGSRGCSQRSRLRRSAACRCQGRRRRNSSRCLRNHCRTCFARIRGIQRSRLRCVIFCGGPVRASARLVRIASNGNVRGQIIRQRRRCLSCRCRGVVHGGKRGQLWNGRHCGHAVFRECRGGWCAGFRRRRCCRHWC